MFGLRATIALLPAIIGKLGKTETTAPIAMISDVAACGFFAS